MNHRTTSACNCISVPIINVSTAMLFTKAVIIKSQVGEVWNTNAYLKKPFLCNSVSKYPNTKFAVVFELSWGVYFWNSILNGFLGIWLPVKKPLPSPLVFLMFFEPEEEQRLELFLFPLTDISSECWICCQRGREDVLHFPFSPECLLSKQNTRITDFPHPPHSHSPHHHHL